MMVTLNVYDDRKLITKHEYTQNNGVLSIFGHTAYTGYHTVPNRTGLRLFSVCVCVFVTVTVSTVTTP